MNYKILAITVLVAAVAFTAGAGLSQAQSSTLRPTLVDRLAQRFNLKSSDVQSEFDAWRNQKQTDRLSRYEDRLNQAVTEGKLTSAQKDLLLAKVKEIQSLRQNQIADLKAWLDKNNLDSQWLWPVGSGHIGKGMRGGMSQSW